MLPAPPSNQSFISNIYLDAAARRHTGYKGLAFTEEDEGHEGKEEVGGADDADLHGCNGRGVFLVGRSCFSFSSFLGGVRCGGCCLLCWWWLGFWVDTSEAHFSREDNVCLVKIASMRRDCQRRKNKDRKGDTEKVSKSKSRRDDFFAQYISQN